MRAIVASAWRAVATAATSSASPAPKWAFCTTTLTAHSAIAWPACACCKRWRSERHAEEKGVVVESPARLDGLRVVFFGMGGVFSRLPLEALLRAGVDLRAVVTPAQPGLALTDAADKPFTRLAPPTRHAPRRALPLAGAMPAARSLLDLAAERGAPLLSVARLADPATLDA